MWISQKGDDMKIELWSENRFALIPEQPIDEMILSRIRYGDDNYRYHVNLSCSWEEDSEAYPKQITKLNFDINKIKKKAKKEVS